MARCRKCPAEIVFAKTASGKWMPIDKVPNVDGNLADAGFDDEGTMLVAPVDLFTGPDATRYMPHWATCPAAEDFRS